MVVTRDCWMNHSMRQVSTKTRGGVRPIVPARRCRYCNKKLDRYCKAKKVWNIGPVRVDVYILICRTNGCRERAAMDGWL